MLWTEAALCSRVAGEGAGGMLKGGGRMVEQSLEVGEEHLQVLDTPQASQTTVPPARAPRPNTRRALAEGLLGEVKRAVS